ncbi:MAG TPA: glucose-1-phosphate cytidylyltransferase [Azospirillaceae bacterium]|nr:glucose-1-phosphate cytidylyltransferase [Azospirillaceae bacterium]
MKLVILAGGLGTRLSEETARVPKPMVTIGGHPILWHIMKIYSAHGVDDFIICLGHLGYVIKEYFANYALHRSDVTFDYRTGEAQYHKSAAEPWRVTLVDTGSETMTGGRLRRVGHLLEPGETFCMTYGDGVGDVDVTRSIEFHKGHGLEATMTVVRPPGRFGATVIKDGKVVDFAEKPEGDGGVINGGFFVLNQRVVERVTGDEIPWERAPLEGLARDGQLAAFHHDGFWQPMDTLREKQQLEAHWASGTAPWKVW